MSTKSIMGIFAVVSTLGLASTAGAAVLSTPALFTDPGTYVRCIVTNVSEKPIAGVRIEGLNLSGVVFTTTPEPGLTLAPGATESVLAPSGTSTACRFIVPSKTKVRAHACVSDNGTVTCDAQADAR